MEVSAVEIKHLVPPGSTDNLPSPSQAPVDSDRRFSFDTRSGYGLPPQDYWLIDAYDRSQRIPTPVNEHGLVDTEAVISLVKSKVLPEYKWPSNRLSIHHEYYNRSWYGFPSAGEGALEFRELPINKILVPRVFENFLHRILLQPDVPSSDVMEEVTRSYHVTNKLFRLMQAVVRCERGVGAHISRLEQSGTLLPDEFRDQSRRSQHLMLQTLDRHFSSMHDTIDEMEIIPSEFRLAEPDRTVVVDPDRRKRYSGAIGRLVVPRAKAMIRPIVSTA